MEEEQRFSIDVSENRGHHQEGARSGDNVGDGQLRVHHHRLAQHRSGSDPEPGLRLLAHASLCQHLYGRPRMVLGARRAEQFRQFLRVRLSLLSISAGVERAAPVWPVRG